jgi:hypothetical protein
VKRKRRKGGVLMHFDEPTTARLNQHQRRLEAEVPGARLDRKGVLHNLILAGLDAAEQATEPDGGAE